MQLANCTCQFCTELEGLRLIHHAIHHHQQQKGQFPPCRSAVGFAAWSLSFAISLLFGLFFGDVEDEAAEVVDDALAQRDAVAAERALVDDELLDVLRAVHRRPQRDREREHAAVAACAAWVAEPAEDASFEHRDESEERRTRDAMDSAPRERRRCGVVELSGGHLGIVVAPWRRRATARMSRHRRVSIVDRVARGGRAGRTGRRDDE